MSQPERIMNIQRFAIIGVGLLGGSLGLAVRRAFPACRIIGCDNPAALDKARAIGAIDEGAVDSIAATRDSDVVVLCTPVSVAPRILTQIAPSLKGGCLLTD